MKLNGKSQATLNTFKNIILGNTLENNLPLFFSVPLEYNFSKSRGKESLKLTILLNWVSLSSVIKQEDFERSVLQFPFHAAAQPGVCQWVSPSRRAKYEVKFTIWWRRMFGIRFLCDDGSLFKIKLPLHLLSLTLTRKIMAVVTSLLEEYCFKAVWGYISWVQNEVLLWSK